MSFLTVGFLTSMSMFFINLYICFYKPEYYNVDVLTFWALLFVGLGFLKARRYNQKTQGKHPD
ncbi:hypothetical protein [Thalassotalea sp. PLHSN55]|uniref:hypothetical protein n=1 Tax=Thalassotalea sp. PLHSN55 TaxID=3435888 RepID=UPI003F84F55C